MSKHTTMTSKEILNADVLDILFENKNKTYGAYALRKTYDQRLALALGLALTSVLLMWLLSAFMAKDAAPGTQERSTFVTLTHIDPPQPPEPPKPPVPRVQRPAAAQRIFVNNIQLVTDDVKPEMPAVLELAAANIGAVNIEGPVPDGTVHPLANSNQEAATSEAPPAAFVPLEKQPEFPGGIHALAAFLSQNLETPAEMEAGEKKTVWVKFVVNEDGTVTQFEIIQSAGTLFDKEVLRVMKKMPRWKPAVQNGHYVATAFTQPVTFQSVEE